MSGPKVAADSLTGADINEGSLTLPPNTASGVAGGNLTGADILDSSLDFAVIQQRVSGTCAAGSSIRTIAQDGSVICETEPTTLPPSGAAGGDLTGTYPNPSVANDAVDAGDIQDPTRSVNLPLDGFVNCDSVNFGPIDFASGTDTVPDYEVPSDGRLVLSWDNGPGADVNDTDPVCTSLMVPADYASGGTVRLITLRTATGANDWLATTVRQRSAQGEATTTSASSGGTSCVSGFSVSSIHPCVLTITDALAAGDALTIGISAASANTMALYAVEFGYTAGS